MGIGGGAADAQHIAAELVAKLRIRRKALAAIALTTDSSILTAVSNDFGFEECFSRQVEALGVAGDIVIAICTRGASRNVVRAAPSAREIGCSPPAFTRSRGSGIPG